MYLSMMGIPIHNYQWIANLCYVTWSNLFNTLLAQHK